MFKHVPTNFIIPEISATTTEAGRTYTLPSGSVVPSITTVLSINDEEWLEEWRRDVGDFRANQISKIATVRGDAVHDMTENYLNNMDRKEVILNREHIHIIMFHRLRFLLKHIDNIVTQEQGLYSEELGIAGRVDCIGEYKGKLSIIDFKTSTNIKDKSKISNYFKQGAAYSIMWEELTGISIDSIAILMTVKNSLVPIEFIEPVNKWIKPLKADIKKFNKTNHGLELHHA